MSLKHLILGLLNQEPLSGYDLNKRFQEHIQPFWTTEQSQIYRALHKMHTDGWLDLETIIQADSPNKKIYSLTTQGQAELHEWLKTPIFDEPARLTWMAQLYFGDVLEVDDLLTLMKAYWAKMKDAQDTLNEIVSQTDIHLDDPTISREHFSQLLPLDYGRELISADIQWIEKIIKLLQLQTQSKKH
jgi:PadR family transcriptional regulator AphA